MVWLKHGRKRKCGPGWPAPAHDLQIAATALVAESAVATLNVFEFSCVPRLQLAELTPSVRL